MAGIGKSGPIGAEACRGRCGSGDLWSLAAQQAEQARVRLGAGYGGSAGGDVTGETTAVGVVGHGNCVDRVRWLAWRASCVDCVSSCGSTVPAVARVGEAGAGWEQRGAGESMSLAVGYRGLRCVKCDGATLWLSAAARLRQVSRGKAGRLSRSASQPEPPVYSDVGLGAGVINAGTPDCHENPTGRGDRAKGLVTSRGSAVGGECDASDGRGKSVVQYQD